MNRILITGASGFIGGRAFEAFKQAGWETVGAGRRPTKLDCYYQCDLSNPKSVEALFSKLGRFDVILHAAARSSPWGPARAFYKANVVATQNIVDIASSIGLPKLIFVSSSSVFYQPCDQTDIDEQTPFASKPVNAYAASKQRSEQIVRGYPGAWCTLRPRAVYGVGDTVLFPRILMAAKAGRLPCFFRDGEPAMGDLLCIDNLLHCFEQAACNKSIQGEYNITDNQPVPIWDFVLEVFQRLNIPIPKKRMSVATAYRIACLLETSYKALLPWKEPPITRFGVHVFAFSKTFNVQKMLNTFGPPIKSVEAGVREFIHWVSTEKPYDK